MMYLEARIFKVLPLLLLTCSLGNSTYNFHKFGLLFWEFVLCMKFL